MGKSRRGGVNSWEIREREEVRSGRACQSIVREVNLAVQEPDVE